MPDGFGEVNNGLVIILLAQAGKAPVTICLGNFRIEPNGRGEGSDSQSVSPFFKQALPFAKASLATSALAATFGSSTTANSTTVQQLHLFMGFPPSSTILPVRPTVGTAVAPPCLLIRVELPLNLPPFRACATDGDLHYRRALLAGSRFHQRRAATDTMRRNPIALYQSQQRRWVAWS